MELMERFCKYFGEGIRIVAMDPEGGPHTTCSTLEQAVQLNKDGNNIYFTANPATDAGVAGLTSIRFVYTEVDPDGTNNPAQIADSMYEDGLTVWGTGRGQVGLSLIHI